MSVLDPSHLITTQPANQNNFKTQWDLPFPGLVLPSGIGTGVVTRKSWLRIPEVMLKSMNFGFPAT